MVTLKETSFLLIYMLISLISLPIDGQSSEPTSISLSVSTASSSNTTLVLLTTLTSSSVTQPTSNSSLSTVTTLTTTTTMSANNVSLTETTPTTSSTTITTTSTELYKPKPRSEPGLWLLAALLIAIVAVIILGIVFYRHRQSPYRRFLQNWRSTDDDRDNIILQLEQTDNSYNRWPSRISFS